MWSRWHIFNKEAILLRIRFSICRLATALTKDPYPIPGNSKCFGKINYAPLVRLTRSNRRRLHRVSADAASSGQWRTILKGPAGEDLFYFKIDGREAGETDTLVSAA